MERDSFRVLLVDDDEDDAFIVRRRLEKARTVDCALTWAASYEQGLQQLCAESFDAALVDYRLGTHTGLDLLHAADDRGVHTPIILLTGQGSLDLDLRAMEAGAADYLTKTDLSAELLERALRYARERAKSAREIRRQAALLNEAQDAICTYDLDGDVTYWNEGARRMTGHTKESACNIHASDCLYGANPEAVEQAWKEVMAHGEWTGELQQSTADGTEIFVESRWTLVEDAAGDPEAVLVLNTDITERKRLEQQALRSQRMESIGRLVGGIAHDLGNLLVPIQLGVSVLRNRYPNTEGAERSLRMIEKSAERGSDMVDRVLSFARGVDGERQPLDLADIAREVEDLVEESFPHDIDFDADFPADLPLVRGDATQLQQVLVNLSVNARDAMPEGGRLSLDAQAVALSEHDPRLLPDAAPGAYVHVCVEDTGAGIPPDALDKIFEPFFSTKSSDDGTGLGLSTVYSIIKSHEGFVDVQSTVGQGTSFDLFLPVASEPEDPPSPGAPIETPEASSSGERRVLVVDDEAFIRESTKTVLEAQGYHPLSAGALDEAQRLLQEHPVDVILTDAALGSETGNLDMVQSFKAQCPETPVIVCSGRSDPPSDQLREAGAAHFLPKPFDADALRDALRAVLPVDTSVA